MPTRCSLPKSAIGDLTMDTQNVKHRQRAWAGLAPPAVEARRLSAASLVLCLSLVTLHSSAAGEPANADRVIDGFLEACEAGDWLNEKQGQKARDIVSRLRRDGSTAGAAITEALRETCPDFAAALKALSDKDGAGAVSRLRPLAAAENPYLAAESSFFLAKAYVQQDDYEQAVPLLEELVGKHSGHSLRVGEAMFLRGISEMHLLRRIEAMASFAAFLQDNPNASAPILAAARQNLELLEQLELGSLEDIHDQTQYSERRLSLERSGKETQEVQDQIVAMLTSLIEQMEKCGGNCSGCSRCQGGGKSGGGQGGATPGISSGTSTAARRVIGGGASTAWADLRNKARQARAFAAMDANFPARYRQLVEQYYRSLQEEAEP